tara:strand:+ start:436 stop:2796 length:2361 start_codon:yes stop_codon:yes gene_type:complete
LAKSPKQLDPLHGKYSKCIDVAVQAGKITKSMGQEILKADSPEDAISNLVKNISREKREKAIQSIRIAEAFDNIQKHGSNNAMTGLMSLMVKDISGKASYLNVDMLGKAYTKKYMAKWSDSLSMFRTRMFGLSQDEKGLNKFIRAVYGETIDDAEITKSASDWLKLVDDMRDEFNVMGGSISKNEKFLLPQAHDLRRVRAVKYEDWRAFIIDKLDRNQMVDDKGRVLSDGNFEDSLKYVYETISTGGLNKAKDFTIRNLGTKLSRKGSEKRFLYFKDAESWMAYQNEFGKGDILTTLTDHIQAMGNDTALMRVFGTNPKQTFEILKTEAEKLEISKNKIVKDRTKATLNAVYKTVSGDINNGELVTLADGLQFVRNIQVASKLGGATLSSVTDLATTALTANYNKIPVAKVFARQMKLMNPANEENRIFAARMGLIFDGWFGRAHSANRFSDTYGTGASAKTAEAVLRFSGLEAWTEGGRKAFGMEFAGMLSDNFAKKFDELDPAIQSAFKNYQITKADWDNFRATKPLDLRGSKFADLTKDESMKFHSMILSETDYAVPTPDARVRAIATGGTERGTIWGQVSRSAMMIKSFPITIATTHLYRGATQATTGGKMMYLGSFATATTLMGAFALQIKDLAAGREPRPMDDPEDWVTAFVQGGSGSLFADYVVSDVNKYGRGFVETLLGPMASLTNDTYKLTIGNIREAVTGDETNVLGESAKFIKDITPDPWQIQLFMNSMFDNIRLMADPDYQSSLNRIRTKRYEEFGQEYWWAPAETPMEVLEDL